MSQTVVPWGDPKAQKKWATGLASDTNRKSYFTKKFVGRGDNNIIEEKTELTADAGDRISFDLCVQLRSRPVAGDNRAKGQEENLRFYTDEVAIDQLRKPVSCGGRMSRKRQAHDLRKVGRDKLSEYWKAYMDEIQFIYLSGARGINEDYREPVGYTGHARNAIQAPDADHIVFGGAATASANLTAADRMTRDVVERVAVKAKMMRATNPDTSDMVPISVEGENRFVCLMSCFQAHDMRTDTGTGNWLDIQKAAAAAEGSKTNKIFRGNLGMINNVVLHEHESVIRFNDYGAGADVQASRALFMGRQAGVIAYGTPGGMRFMWKEEMEDFDNEPIVNAGLIFGLKKTRYNGRDFGSIAIDTAAMNPN